MPLPGFGSNLRERFNMPFRRCRFQSAINASANFGDLFISQIVRVIHQIIAG